MNSLNLRRHAAVFAVFISAVTAGHAQNSIILQGGDVRVTNADLAAESLRIPEQSRRSLMSRKDNVEQMASSIYVRRALAAEALADGLDKDPAVVAQLQLVRDKVLSDARLAKLEAAAAPSDAAALSYARDAYRAEPKRFESPESWRARHILVRGTDKAEAKAKAEKILAELKGGAPFAETAKQRSEDHGSAARGGELGFFPAGRMVQPFEEAVRKLKPGQLSDVVETQFGFHIILLEEARPAGVRPFDEIKDEMVKGAKAKIVEDAISKKVTELKALGKFDQAAVEAYAASNSK